MAPRRISILGVGLLGGSVGLAAKAGINDCEVVGYGHRPATLETALQIRAIDRATVDLGEAVRGADLVILCTPVGTFARLIEEMAPSLAPGTVVTDVGSTKRTVVRLAEERLGGDVRFVGSHPMAGSEKRGVEFARTDLFQNALCILTPTEHTAPSATGMVEGFWRTLGMRTTRLSPERHDQLLADVSHLPHTVAAALVAMQEEPALPLAGKGFLDATRIAGGDGALWRDILMDNRDNMRASIARLKENLGEVERMLSEDRADDLARWLDAAAARREALVQRRLRETAGD